MLEFIDLTFDIGSLTLPVWLCIVIIAAILVLALLITFICIKAKNKNKNKKKEEKIVAKEPVAPPEEEKAPLLDKGTIYMRLQRRRFDPFLQGPKKKEPVPVATPKPILNYSKKKPDPLKKEGTFFLASTSHGEYYFYLILDGKMIFESKLYKSEIGCRQAILDFRSSAEAGFISIRCDLFGKYKFVLQSINSSATTYEGSDFTFKKECERRMNDIKNASFVDEIFVDDEQKEIILLEKPTENNTVSSGKWVIKNTDSFKKNPGFVFLLRRADSSLLYESRPYKSDVSCQNGIETFKKALANGVYSALPVQDGFRITITSAVVANTSFDGGTYSTLDECKEAFNLLYNTALVTA